MTTFRQTCRIESCRVVSERTASILRRKSFDVDLMSVSQGPVSWTVRRLCGENRVDEVRMYVHQLSETCSVFSGVQFTTDLQIIRCFSS